jgi:VanZ family protein
MIALILLSSTSAAARFCDAAFYKVLGGFFPARGAHDTLMAIHFMVEKGAHLALFFFFGLLLTLVGGGSMRRRIPFVFVSGAVLGIAAEYLQTFFAGRDPTIQDALIDLCGTCLGALTIATFSKRRTHR